MLENQRLTEEEQEIEERAFQNFERNLPALVEEYGRRFGHEISTDNAREIVSAEYAASTEARTHWSAAARNRLARCRTISSSGPSSTWIRPSRVPL